MKVYRSSVGGGRQFGVSSKRMIIIVFVIKAPRSSRTEVTNPVSRVHLRGGGAMKEVLNAKNSVD